MRGVPTRRYSLLPPAEGRLPALLPLAGEGGAKRRMRGERSELLLIFLRRPAADQHQELSRRDGASHLSLRVPLLSGLSPNRINCLAAPSSELSRAGAANISSSGVCSNSVTLRICSHSYKLAREPQRLRTMTINT